MTMEVESVNKIKSLSHQQQHKLAIHKVEVDNLNEKYDACSNAGNGRWQGKAYHILWVWQLFKNWLEVKNLGKSLLYAADVMSYRK